MKATLLLVFALALLATVQSARPKWHQLEGYNYEKYVNDFGKTYSAKEYMVRQKIFEARLEEIKQHNADSTKSWKRGINHLSDYTPDEFRALLGYDKRISAYMKQHNSHRVSNVEYDISTLPKQVDWRTITTPVKDQGNCGSCWTFATAESVESYWAIKTGELMELSEQQILDCTPNPDQCGGSGGCAGGTVELALSQIENLGGLTTEWMYPYTSHQGSNFNCYFDPNVTRPFAKVSGYVVLPSNQYSPLLGALATVGPIAISVDASAWSDYESGVFNGCNQTNPDLDHAVQLVGYGTDEELGDYWLVRNSWTAAWGEDGYIRLQRTADIQCGVDIRPLDGDGCKNGPPEVTVCGTCGILYDSVYPEI